MPFKINILVVDDSKANQSFMAHILQKESLRIVCADSCDQALLKIYQHDFALILMDVLMPGKTGFETAELIRKVDKSAGIPIIFVTAFKEDKSFEFKGYEAGAVDFLFKPVDPFILKTKVKIFAELYRREKALQITRAKLETTLNEQKRLEGQLRQAQKMEAVGTLAGGIAHDFNNILAAIMGYIELAQFELPENNKARHSLNQVLKASHRAKKLVSHILSFSRQSGNEKKPLVMQNIVKEAVDLLRATLPSTISIKQNIDSSFASVKADPTQLHQILMNLGTNAYHAIGDVPGLIEISMGEVRPDKKQIFDFAELNPGHYVRLCVRDNGCGMAPATISKIFDPYFTTKEKGVGTGMGLSVVHGIIKAHSGVINVASQPGRGSEFNIFFPVAGAVEEPPVDIAGLPEGGNERVLFVDDEEMLAGLVTRMLEKLGYSVVAETSSVRALDIFKADHSGFDLVISDLTMPDLTGIQLAREIRAVSPEIPIILCTGYSKKTGKELLAELGVEYLLHKPLEIKELANVLRKALGSVLEVQECRHG